MTTMKNLMITAAFIATISANVAGADERTSNLTYDQFIDSCQNPASYGAQIPPQNIRVMCKNVQTTWQPIEAGGTVLSEGRILTSELFSNKYHVALESFVIETPEFNVACPRFREVVETSQIEKSLTCAQVLAETRTLKEICLDAINEAISANPDLVESEPTGNTFDTCTGNGQKL